MNRCVETERRALLKFKDAIIHGNVNFTSWKGEECCKWKGISCDNLTGHVTSLYLYPLEYTIGGKLDSSICELQHLTFLSLHDIGLEGKIPKCIGSLGQLTELILPGNNFVGVIPPTLRNLSNLQILDLSNNIYMILNDLEWLSHLSNLTYLDLSNVNLTLVGDWFSSISKFPSLSTLYLSNCGLHQFTPKSIPHMNTSINASSVLTILYLSNNELEGSIPKSFRSMYQLKHLYLNSNKLSGQLSDNIQQLCCAINGLEYLDLNDNSFESGPLPNISCFSSLRSLSLRNTNVVGLLPKSIVHSSFLQDLDLSHNHLNGVDIIDDAYLSTLQSLDLSFNQLSGSTPLFEITKLVSLDTLYLSHNQLSGPFPHTIGQLPKIALLFLSTNKFKGVINENHLSNFSKLRVLDVSQNSLSFNLSSEWVPPFQLDTLYASSCTLGPKFPAWLKHQRELMSLDFSNTGISDSFPKWFWNLSSSFQYLNVSHNKLEGPLPKSFPSMSVNDNNYAWDFSLNSLNGSLPHFPGSLNALFLSNNMFTGSLSSFCTSSSLNLRYLDLSNNLLAAKLSDCWEKFQWLQVLNLANNNLSGKIPNSFGALRQIESIHLNNNNFFGEIPPLTHCSSLTLIDVGDNNLQGILPMWIGYHLHQLIVLRLRGNKFKGNIPTSMCNLSFLQVLDLSENKITGEIPQCFGDIIALSDLKSPRKSFHYISFTEEYMENEEYEIGSFNDKEILALKGSNREYERNLGLMATIDLSCNHLTGEIPQSITKLVALVGLNLSGNNLTGFIPNNIGHMERLESLDLSRNHLYGKMPSSFTNLTFLSCMNLSFNNLEGEIPLSTQLQSFDPSSFEGNARLCGLPLINLCPDDAISPTRSHEKHVTDEDEDKLITFGFYVSLVVGFFVGFWGVCGTLVIKTSWRHAYFRFFKNMNDRIHVTLAVFVNKLKNRFQVKG
ncbi:receptor protein EIX2 [Trifolium repens]|nr:receptor protein EIX2 [Trifolium repens]